MKVKIVAFFVLGFIVVAGIQDAHDHPVPAPGPVEPRPVMVVPSNPHPEHNPGLSTLDDTWVNGPCGHFREKREILVDGPCILV